MTLADYFVEKAEQCFRLAKFARGHVLSPETARAIDALGEELMNKAVEIDTTRQRAETAAARMRDERRDLAMDLAMDLRRAKVSVFRSPSPHMTPRIPSSQMTHHQTTSPQRKLRH